MHRADAIDFLLVYFAAALLLLPLSRRLGVSSVLGYLAAGLLVGPSGLSWVEKNEAVEIASEVGVLFLLFVVGLELSSDRLAGLRRDALGLGTAQVLTTGAVLALVLAGFGTTPAAAIVIGFSLALSSTAIVLQILRESGELSRRTGRAALGVLLLQDLAVVPLLVAVPLLARGGEGLVAALGLAALKAVVAVAVLVFVGRRILQRLYTEVARLREPEVALLLTLLVAIGTGALTEAAGLSAPLGAFLAGVLLAETDFRHQVTADVLPFRGLLLGVFFVGVGLSIDVSLLADRGFELALLVTLLLVAKGGLLFALGRPFGLTTAQSLHLAFLLPQAGEFAFVTLGAAIAAGVVSPEAGTLFLATVTAGMFLSPPLALAGRRLATRIDRAASGGAASLDREARELENHVVVAGGGRVGSTVIRVLAENGIGAVAVDADPERVSALRRIGVPAVVGDASRSVLLEAAGVGRARAVVVTLDDPVAAERICSALRRDHPKLDVIARASDAAHGARLLEAGAGVAVAENLEGSLELAARALEAFEIPGPEIDRCLDALRADDYAKLLRS